MFRYNDGEKIKKMEIIRFNIGIYLNSSSTNTISGNNITNNDDGIVLWYSSNHNSVSGNNLRGNGYGMWLSSSSDNSIYGNDIVANIEGGIRLNDSSNDFIYHNSFVDNARQIYDMSWDNPWYPPSINTWDDGAGKGNYWSDYEYKYPNAEELDGTGIWDTPYVIDENNQDNYSIVPEFSSLIILPLFMIVTLFAVIAYKRKQSM